MDNFKEINSKLIDFGVIIIGDEILSGKRSDKHLSKTIEILSTRGLKLAWAEYCSDVPDQIAATLRRRFKTSSVVFCFGGIGATPDDHTRRSAAVALGVALALQPEAAEKIRERIRDVAETDGVICELNRPDNVHRLQMAMFPIGATVIPNPYNKISGFSCVGSGGGHINFVPGFPVMAWPMVEWVLDTQYPSCERLIESERSIIVMGAAEAALVPLMESIENSHPGVKVFSLPSLAHPEYGHHIELGVKGEVAQVALAFTELRASLAEQSWQLGPELVR